MAEIICENLKLNFPLGFSFGRLLRRGAASTEFNHGVPALRGVDLHLTSGMRVGLVGRNGAGKSTLLKVMSGIFVPNSGTARIRGRVTSLLSLRGGFDLQSTGRENIWIRSILQGARRKEIVANIDDIIAFADIGNFIDLPISTYSNGMVTRLALGIATAYRPEIVLMDEGIMAGDEAFRDRARARLDRFVSEAGILVMAAHSRPLINSMCSHAIWMEAGKVHMFGPAREVLNAYARDFHGPTAVD